LRTHVIKMGGKYNPDLEPNVTILLCNYKNTPRREKVVTH